MLLSHRKLARWYEQLAPLLDAGLSLTDALRAAGGTGPGHEAREAMARAVEQGGSVDDALRVAEHWLPESDRLGLSAAADAGRMPSMLRQLAERHAQLAAAHRKLAIACAYPLFVLHFAILIRPVLGMINWDRGFVWSTSGYVQALAFTLGPLWLILGVLFVLARQHSPALRQIGRRIPLIAGYIRNQALADLAFALGSFISSGVPIGQAWAAAGLISHSPTLRRAAERLAVTIGQGVAPGTQLATWPCFPPEFVALYRTGETTGQVDIQLLRLSAQYQDSANRTLTVATIVYPALLFGAVALMVAYTVLKMYSGYLGSIEKLA